MKNTLKAFLLTLIIYNIPLIYLYFSPIIRYWRLGWPLNEQLPFLPYLLLGLISSNMHLLALFFIIGLPLFKLTRKYTNSSWAVPFLIGFIIWISPSIIHMLISGKPLMTVISFNVIPFIIYPCIFASLYWWFDRGQKRRLKPIPLV